MKNAAPMTRAYTFAPNIEYIKEKRGELGVSMVLEDMKRKGYELDMKLIKKPDWVPIELRKQFLYSVRDTLGWDADKIYAMGYSAPRLSYVLKIYFGLFITAEKAFSEAPNMWQKHYSGSNLRIGEKWEKGGTLIIEDFDLDPLFCRYIEGYLQGFGDLSKSKNVRVRETKCTFKGEAYHEYTVTWD